MSTTHDIERSRRKLVVLQAIVERLLTIQGPRPRETLFRKLGQMESICADFSDDYYEENGRSGKLFARWKNTITLLWEKFCVEASPSRKVRESDASTITTSPGDDQPQIPATQESNNNELEILLCHLEESISQLPQVVSFVDDIDVITKLLDILQGAYNQLKSHLHNFNIQKRLLKLATDKLSTELRSQFCSIGKNSLKQLINFLREEINNHANTVDKNTMNK